MIDDKAAREFFKSQIKDISSASRAVCRSSAQKLKTEMQKQVRRNFKRGSNSNGSFFKAFKIYNLDENASQGAASYVRAGVPFLSIFETGGTITPKGKYFIKLLPSGEKLGFKRVTKGNTWDNIYNKYKRYLRLVKTADGILVIYDYQGRKTPIYFFSKQSKIPKKIDFYATAERIANEMPDKINQLLK